MGKDGAAGMAQMKKAGGYNFAQNEESCVVYGMPKEAVAQGGVDVVAHLNDLPKLVLDHLTANSARALRV
jgi:two-component system chemotaxis response regulator CheB